MFGEIALLDGRPRTADATTMSNCELIVIERRDFVPFLRTIRTSCSSSSKFSARGCAAPASKSRIHIPEPADPAGEDPYAAQGKGGDGAKRQAPRHPARAQPDDRPLAREHQQAAASVGEARLDQARTRRSHHRGARQAHRGGCCRFRARSLISGRPQNASSPDYAVAPTTPCAREQLRQLAAGIEHWRLHGIARDADDHARPPAPISHDNRRDR